MSNLTETNSIPVEAVVKRPWPLQVMAKTLSFLFHPLFVPTYFFLYLMQAYPYEFAGITDWQLKLRVFGVFWMTAFFPAFAVFLLWRLS